jgi:hypothetical protein
MHGPCRWVIADNKDRLWVVAAWEAVIQGHEVVMENTFSGDARFQSDWTRTGKKISTDLKC